MNPDNINYTPLEAMNHAWLTTMRRGLGGWLWPLTFVVALAAIGISFISHDVIAIWFALFLYVLAINVLVRRYKNQIWQQFAAANGWNVEPSETSRASMPPSLQFGHSQHASPVIDATIGNCQCAIYEYDTTTGEGKYQTTHFFTVAVTALPKPMPHMILRAKKGADSDMQSDLANAEKLQLEGDFNDYFKLEVEKGQEIDVLTIITPDVMQTLISYSQAEDLEILESGLYFIVRGDDRGPKQMRQLIQSVVELNAQLQENARLSTPQPQAQETSAPPVSVAPEIVTPTIPTTPTPAV